LVPPYPSPRSLEVGGDATARRWPLRGAQINSTGILGRERMAPRAQRTLGPLHFEDLEPHRFEDLVRQLAYGWRPWRYLDATGRLGQDEGLDIHGAEIVAASGPEPDVEAAEEGDEETASPILEEREWRIQCKRHRRIGPTLMRETVADVIPDGQQAPYGLIIAAACDVSAQTTAAFREEALTRGVTEAHLWTKAHLEDMLFSPGNDHLLFAYFGISLGIRRRSQLQRVRALIALKRKLMRAFKLDSVEAGGMFADVLIRDIADDQYPITERIRGYFEMSSPPWHFGAVEGFHPKGLEICRLRYDGWVKPDGGWDILEKSAQAPAGMAQSYFDWLEENGIRTKGGWSPRDPLYEKVPETQQRSIREVRLLPFDNIAEVDPVGDPLCPEPHLYCRFDGDDGPYVGKPRFVAPGKQYYDHDQYLDDDKRKPLFANVRGRAESDRKG